MEQPFDALQAEKSELDILIDNGFDFTVERQSIFRYLSKKKERKFIIRSPFLGTMDYLSAEYIKMTFDEEAIKEDWLKEGPRMIMADTRQHARVVAIAVLRNKWKIKLFLPFMASYFLWRIDSRKLQQLAYIIYQASNIPDFIGSTKLLFVKNRTTTPKLVETPQQEEKDEPLD